MDAHAHHHETTHQQAEPRADRIHPPPREHRRAWSQAARATLHCLLGCATGEVLGLVIGTALGLSTLSTIALAVALAFVFGYAFTLTPVLRTGMALKAALAVTLAADTVSITVMEVVDNSVMLLVPGAMDAGLGQRPVLGGAGGLARGRVRRHRPRQPLAHRPGPRPRGRPRTPLTPRHPGPWPARRLARRRSRPLRPLRYPVSVTRFELLP